MTLQPGSRLGGYEIQAAIGAGGMGEVYRALDARLGRLVAIKVLPERLSSDADALARFEREARAVATLSHPNIMAIYELGEDSGVRYAVMELLEGETLRGRLESDPPPPRRAIEYAQQVARGLAAAHARGIVHRDLKPDNIFLTGDGQVKILDFGLARPSSLARPGSDSAVATLVRETDPGTVLGTVGYMSPEQARGEVADERSDIFALGVVLHEMLSGGPPFRRDTAVETLNAILKEDAPHPSQGRPDVPEAADHVVLHCLEKRPDDRFQSARDLAFDLSRLSSPSTRSGAGELGPASNAPSMRWKSPLAVAVAAIVGIGLGRSWPAGDPGVPASRAPQATFRQMTDLSGVESQPSLSPDGKNLVFVAGPMGHRDIYMLRVGGRNPINLTSDAPEDDEQPAFSPDGETIAFRSERDGGGIFVMGSTGESVRRVTDSGSDPSWSPDGRALVVSSVSFADPLSRTGHGGLWVVDVATGERRRIATSDDAVQPSWSPAGHRIAYWGVRGGSGQRDLWTVPADGSPDAATDVSVTNDTFVDWSPSWSPDGRWLYYASTRGGTMNLWRIAIDEVTGIVRGDPEPLTTPASWGARPHLSADARHIVYETLDWRSALLRAEFDPIGERIVGSPQPILNSTQPIRDHETSPDGEWVTFSRAGQEDIFVARLDGSNYRRLTDDGFRDRGPAWSPDGERIAFYSDRSGKYEIWTVRPDGSGLTQVTDVEETVNYPLWSPDGKRLAASNATGNWKIIEVGDAPLPISSLSSTPPFQDGTTTFWALAWSPDGSMLAGGLLTGRSLIDGLASYSISDERYEVLDDNVSKGWLTPRWLSDGRRLMVRDSNGIFLIDTVSKRRAPLLEMGRALTGKDLSLSSDDRWLTFTETAGEGDIWLMDLEDGS